jgi:hypothetical protein
MFNFSMNMATLYSYDFAFFFLFNLSFFSIGCQDPIIDGEAKRRRSVLRQLCRSGPVRRRQSGAEKELNQMAGQADKLAARGRIRRQADESGGKLTNLAAS